MLAALLQNPDVDQYLKAFPRAQWARCLELTMALGVQTAQRKYPYGVTLELLSKLVGAKDSDASRKPRNENRQRGRVHEKRSFLEDRRPKDSLKLEVPQYSEALEFVKPKRSTTSSVDRVTASAHFRSFLKPDISESHFKAFNPLAPQHKLAPSTPSYRPDISYSYKSQNTSSFLSEPRTNQAYVERVIPELDNSLLRITDEFLADPVMATLATPKVLSSLDRW